MAMLPILTLPDPRLRQICASVAGDIHILADDMLETMYDARGRGLAAPQVGEMIRVFVMDVSWKDGTPDPMVFLNPEIVARSDDMVTRSEGCLSIPGVLAAVARPAQITVSWMDLEGVRWAQAFDGFAAACIQHEIDHLDGVVTFDRVDPAQRAKLEAEYDG